MVVGSDQISAGRGLDSGFELFVVRASPGLLRCAYLLVRDHGDAEDLLQVALLRTLDRWDAITGEPAAYAFAVLVNLARDRRRARQRRPVAVSERFGEDQRTADEIHRLLEHDAIVQAARGLSRRQREILACRFVLDLSVSETARVLGIPQGTVKSYTARALTRMRHMLEGDRVTVTGPEREAKDAQ
jgi:RNA polymerase sigma-70 factor (sigma-E family)